MLNNPEEELIAEDYINNIKQITMSFLEGQILDIKEKVSLILVFHTKILKAILSMYEDNKTKQLLTEKIIDILTGKN